MIAFNNDIAEKISTLLNQNNNLYKKYSANDVNHSHATYYPIVVGKAVLGSIAIEKLNFLVTEVKHLVVPEPLRGLGLAKRLLKMVIPEVSTPYLIASIRTNNIASIKVFTSVSFSQLEEVEHKGNTLIVLGRPKVLPGEVEVKESTPHERPIRRSK